MIDTGEVSDLDSYDVTVLMSTYNGEKYIREQIDSILKQKDVNVHLVIRDDNSKDRTVEILHDYQNRFDCIDVLETKENLGACGSFFYLMSLSFKTEYYALADQDDVWDEDKLITAIRMIKDKETKNKSPILYHSNLRVVDSNNNFLRNCHSWSRSNQSKYCFITEVLATGCTIVYNKALSNIAIEKKPTEFSMHDAWLFSVASLFGQVIYDDTPHINYRQHGNNVDGTRKKQLGLEALGREYRRIFNWKDQPRFKNALILNQEFKSELDVEQKEKLNMMLYYKKSISKRIQLLMDKNIYTSNQYLTLRSKIKIILRNI